MPSRLSGLASYRGMLLVSGWFRGALTGLAAASWPWIVFFWPVGGGRGDDDPVDEIGHGQAVPCLILQVGEQDVAAGIAEVEGDPVDAGPQVVPAGPGLHRDVGEARTA